MTMWPGDELEADSGRKFTIERLVAYRGKPDCTYAGCTRMGCHEREDGSWDPGECFGWHCSLCDEPTSMMGHDCPRAAALSETQQPGGDEA